MSFAPSSETGTVGTAGQTEFTVSGSEPASRLDLFLAGRTGISRHAARRLIEEGGVRVAGRQVRKAGLLLAAGQLVALAAPAQDPLRTPPTPQPELPLQVLYLDADVVVLNKPAGWLCHPLRPGERNSLAAALLARHPECATASPDAREGGLCQRLDQYTSGAITAARHGAAWQAMREHFRAGRVEKEYLALVVGVASADTLEVDAPILPAKGPDRHKRLITATTPEQIYHPEALDAETRFYVLARNPRYTLLRAKTTTGRRHQVRAHLSHLGLPLFGDTLYGAPLQAPNSASLVEGYFLHAARIRFPGAQGPIDVEAPLPKERAQFLADQGLSVPARP